MMFNILDIAIHHLQVVAWLRGWREEDMFEVGGFELTGRMLYTAYAVTQDGCSYSYEWQGTDVDKHRVLGEYNLAEWMDQIEAKAENCCGGDPDCCGSDYGTS